MSRDDWYRHHTWTHKDQTEFLARLGRSRGAYHKAQYTRIQAYELHHRGGKKYARAALMLLDTILREWRTEADLAMVFHQRAECLLDMGDTEEALASFKEVFEAQRSRPGVLTSAHLDFAWWVAVGGRIDLFDDAFAVLDEFEYGLVFPAVVYATYGAKALMYSARGDSQKASECARWAIEATEQKRSVLRYHPTTGIVRIKDGDVHRRLQLLATG